MSSHFLPVYRANAELEADDLDARLAAGAGGPHELTRACKLRRLVAIAALLADGDAAAFRDGLAASARALAAWLDARGPQGLALSRCTGLIDAIAAGEWSLAAKIAHGLREVQWQPEAEYEESYLQAKLIMLRVAVADGGREARAALLSRHRALEGDAVDWQRELAAALEAGNAVDFDAALEGAMLAERERYAYLRAKDALPPEELATFGCISVEGIAWWRLGTHAGFELQSDYLFVPDLALELDGAAAYRPA